MKNQKIRQMVQLAILTALILLLAFTPLGYLKIGALSITFLTIPVVIGAILMGPWQGAFLGCIFGLTSFSQCFGMDAFGTVLMTINVFYTFVMTVVTRTLMGFLAGLIYRGIQSLFKNVKAIKNKELTTPISCAVACASAPLLNTLFFMSALYLFFHNEQIVLDNMGSAPFFVFVFGSITLNAMLELIATLIIGTAVCTALRRSGIIRDNG